MIIFKLFLLSLIILVDVSIVVVLVDEIINGVKNEEEDRK